MKAYLRRGARTLPGHLHVSYRSPSYYILIRNSTDVVCLNIRPHCFLRVKIELEKKKALDISIVVYRQTQTIYHEITMERALDLVKDVVKDCDVYHICDNSGKRPFRIFKKRKDKHFYHGAEPVWGGIADHQDIDREDYVNKRKNEILYDEADLQSIGYVFRRVCKGDNDVT